ncbi:unnamed protein product [Lactuca saligna]|uniref:Uncharacterized protein n=1 Tax=Lactuca saligna TaxID=75948 RepID=A0AA36A3E1_LACSI|nr:unnamed protein product [Lactuca saligna]
MVQNLSQQSDVADLLGGFKPMNAQFLCLPLYQEFESLFRSTFSLKDNENFLAILRKSVSDKNWNVLSSGLQKGVRTVVKIGTQNPEGVFITAFKNGFYCTSKRIFYHKLEMLKNFQNLEFCSQFYRSYFVMIVQEIFIVPTNTSHKLGFRLHVLGCSTYSACSNKASALITNICQNLITTTKSVRNNDYTVVLRGDSTLRGHFPGEPDAVVSVLGEMDAWIICPFFLQGGHFTIEDVHLPILIMG